MISRYSASGKAVSVLDRMAPTEPTVSRNLAAFANFDRRDYDHTFGAAFAQVFCTDI